MCTPPTAAIVAGGAQALNAVQGASAARSQNRFIQQQGDRNADQAINAMVLTLRDSQVRIDEQRESASGALLQLRRDADTARGTVRASNTTVSGNTIDALLDDYTRQEVIRQRVIETDLKNKEASDVRGFDAIRANTQNNINRGYGQPVQVPNLLGAAVQIGTSAFSGYLSAGGKP